MSTPKKLPSHGSAGKPNLGARVVEHLERWKWEPERHQRAAKAINEAMRLPVEHRARVVRAILEASRGQGLEVLIGIPEPDDTPLKAEAVARVNEVLSEWRALRPPPLPPKRELSKLTPVAREKRVHAREHFRDRWELELATRLLEGLQRVNPAFSKPAVRRKLRPSVVRGMLCAPGKKGAPKILASICAAGGDALGHWATLDQQAFSQAVKDQRAAQKKRIR